MFDEKQDEASVCFLGEFDKSLLRWMERGRLWSENSAPGIRRAFADEILKRISISLHPFFRFPF